MSDITMKIEFLAGTSIEDAVQEAIEKRAAWDVAVITFDFNGVHMVIGETSILEDEVEYFQNNLRLKLCANTKS